MNFNSLEFKKFRRDLGLALAPLEKEYGIRILQGQISYTDDAFSIKLEAEKTIGKSESIKTPEFAVLNENGVTERHTVLKECTINGYHIKLLTAQYLNSDGSWGYPMYRVKIASVVDGKDSYPYAILQKTGKVIGGIETNTMKTASNRYYRARRAAKQEAEK